MFKKMLIALVCLLWTVPAFGEFVQTSWVSRYNGPANGDDGAFIVVVDGSGNVYVAGRSAGVGTGDDFATVKYYPDGEMAWARRYNGPANLNDGVRSVAVDNVGNVYVTGYSPGIGTGHDFATIKYYPDGDTAWVRRFKQLEESDDNPEGIAVDNSGNVYVVGQSASACAILKYYPNGDMAWFRTYRGPVTHLPDHGEAITIDDYGNVYVTGYTWSDTTGRDFITIKFDTSGIGQWVRTYDGPGHARDYGRAIVVDHSGNVYVAGESAEDVAQYDYATVKYHPNGDLAWVARYNGPGNDIEYVEAMAVDASGNVYVTGESYGGSETREDYATVKYYSDGETAWVRRYNGPANNNDWAYDIAVDDLGNVYVTGQSAGIETTDDCATVKYDSVGNEVWVERYNGEINGTDYAQAIALGNSGSVYVAGTSARSIAYPYNFDYVSIEYVQFSHGDANGSGSIGPEDVVYLLSYLYRSGPAPNPLEQGDVNCDGAVGPADVIYLINYLFRNGPPPSC